MVKLVTHSDIGKVMLLHRNGVRSAFEFEPSEIIGGPPGTNHFPDWTSPGIQSQCPEIPLTYVNDPLTEAPVIVQTNLPEG